MSTPSSSKKKATASTGDANPPAPAAKKATSSAATAAAGSAAPKAKPAAKKPAPAVVDDDDSSVSSVSLSGDEAAKEGLDDPNTVTKYKTAADIANRAIKAVVAACVDGAKVLDLCLLGDSTIEEAVKKVYTKGDIKKGVAFPTSVSPGAAICHLSPLSTDPEASTVLKTGDVVRVELGAHVDGYPAQVAHTIVVGASKESPVTGRQADVIVAAHTASEAALRCLKSGFSNWDVTDFVQKIAEDFECKPIEGMLSHQIQRNVIDGPKSIILNPTDQQRKDIEKCTFEDGEAWSIDVLVSTGEGKARTLETRTTIYKRNPDATYQLKMKTSRETLSEVNRKFGGMGFSLRALDDERKARMGILECQNHGLVAPYPVLYEKDGETVAHFMFTVLLMPTGPQKITGLPFEADVYKSDKLVKDEKARDLLKTGVRKATAAKKKKKPAAKAANGGAADKA